MLFSLGAVLEWSTKRSEIHGMGQELPSDLLFSAIQWPFAGPNSDLIGSQKVT